MAKKRSNRSKPSGSKDEADPYGLNEVDDFASKREKVLLGQSSLADRAENDDDDSLLEDEEEEEVLAMDDDDESLDEEEEEEEEEEEKLDGAEAYKKIFGRNLETDQLPEEDEEHGMLDNENAWGSTKGEYYGADDLDDEETAKEIEKEALRQQKKHLEELNMNDYLDEEEEEEWVKNAKEFDMGEFKNSTKQPETKVSVKDILNMDDEARDNYLKTMFPEFAPLSKEFTDLAPKFEALKKIEKNEFNKLKLIALGSYLGTISCYYSIMLHELHNNEDFTSMKGHPVMEKILTTKEIWRQASELPSDFDMIEGEGSESEISDIEAFNEDKLNTLEGEEDFSTEESKQQQKEDEDEEDEEGQSSEEDDVDIDDFEEYVAQSRVNSKPKTVSISEADDFVESEIADVDAQDKKARRRTLRFYTSKIDQQENKKTDRFKGDDDIPYKERLFERQQRLLDEARKRGMHDNNGTDLDGKEYDQEDEAVSRNINTQGENEYYQQVQRGKQNKKVFRKEAHKNAIIAAREGKLAELAENSVGDGKRAINYQILKNKGLTPRRNKDNRNSRVKKRKKYQKAQKKLKSVRAVYSGGQSGAYEGEKTGIKKGLTKSVKFKN